MTTNNASQDSMTSSDADFMIAIHTQGNDDSALGLLVDENADPDALLNNFLFPGEDLDKHAAMVGLRQLLGRRSGSQILSILSSAPVSSGHLMQIGIDTSKSLTAVMGDVEDHFDPNT